jgi:hypothetical protein
MTRPLQDGTTLLDTRPAVLEIGICFPQFLQILEKGNKRIQEYRKEYKNAGIQYRNEGRTEGRKAAVGIVKMSRSR